MQDFNFIIVILAFSFGADLVEGKKQIDVGEALALSLCEQTKSFASTGEFQSPLKKATVTITSSECWLWRWVHCDWPAEEYLWCSDKPLGELKPCGTWDRVPCVPPGELSYCEKFQCGWTLDELHLNWGYNPEHIYPNWPVLAPNDNIIETGMTIDFCPAVSNFINATVPRG